MTRSDKLVHLENDLHDARQNFYKSNEFGKSAGPKWKRMTRLQREVTHFRRDTMDLGLLLPYPEK